MEEPQCTRGHSDLQVWCRSTRSSRHAWMDLHIVWPSRAVVLHAEHSMARGVRRVYSVRLSE